MDLVELVNCRGDAPDLLCGDTAYFKDAVEYFSVIELSMESS